MGQALYKSKKTARVGSGAVGNGQGKVAQQTRDAPDRHGNHFVEQGVNHFAGAPASGARSGGVGIPADAQWPKPSRHTPQTSPGRQSVDGLSGTHRLSQSSQRNAQLRVSSDATPSLASGLSLDGPWRQDALKAPAGAQGPDSSRQHRRSQQLQTPSEPGVRHPPSEASTEHGAFKCSQAPQKQRRGGSREYPVRRRTLTPIASATSADLLAVQATAGQLQTDLVLDTMRMSDYMSTLLNDSARLGSTACAAVATHVQGLLHKLQERNEMLEQQMSLLHSKEQELKQHQDCVAVLASTVAQLNAQVSGSNYIVEPLSMGYDGGRHSVDEHRDRQERDAIWDSGIVSPTASRQPIPPRRFSEGMPRQAAPGRPRDAAPDTSAADAHEAALRRSVQLGRRPLYTNPPASSAFPPYGSDGDAPEQQVPADDWTAMLADEARNARTAPPWDQLCFVPAGESSVLNLDDTIAPTRKLRYHTTSEFDHLASDVSGTTTNSMAAGGPAAHFTAFSGQSGQGNSSARLEGIDTVPAKLPLNAVPRDEDISERAHNVLRALEMEHTDYSESHVAVPRLLAQHTPETALPPAVVPPSNPPSSAPVSQSGKFVDDTLYRCVEDALNDYSSDCSSPRSAARPAAAPGGGRGSVYAAAPHMPLGMTNAKAREWWVAQAEHAAAHAGDVEEAGDFQAYCAAFNPPGRRPAANSAYAQPPEARRSLQVARSREQPSRQNSGGSGGKPPAGSRHVAKAGRGTVPSRSSKAAPTSARRQAPHSSSGVRVPQVVDGRRPTDSARTARRRSTPASSLDLLDGIIAEHLQSASAFSLHDDIAAMRPPQASPRPRASAAAASGHRAAAPEAGRWPRRLHPTWDSAAHRRSGEGVRVVQAAHSAAPEASPPSRRSVDSRIPHGYGSTHHQGAPPSSATHTFVDARPTVASARGGRQRVDAGVPCGWATPRRSGVGARPRQSGDWAVPAPQGRSSHDWTGAGDPSADRGWSREQAHAASRAKADHDARAQQRRQQMNELRPGRSPGVERPWRA